jgi:hypothetical protein
MRLKILVHHRRWPQIRQGGVVMTPEAIERISGEVNDRIAIRNLAKRMGELDDRIADCHTRRKAAIMRAARAVSAAAAATREV